MQTTTVRELRLAASKVLARSRSGPVILMKRGKPVAAIESLRGEDLEDFLLMRHPRFIKAIEEGERDLALGRTISLKDYVAGKRI
jgi:antitoxin (DNA-binding transcriptional repressor) of toxin-antitoxin stability system